MAGNQEDASDSEEETPSIGLLRWTSLLQECCTSWGKAARLGGFVAGELFAPVIVNHFGACPYIS